MKKIILLISAACVSLPVLANPNNINNPAPGFNAPTFNPGYAPNYNRNRGSNWNMPNFNMGNNRRGSNWSMPNMNWGNNRNNFGSGSNWNMPDMNWGKGNGFGRGSNFSMPDMNWGKGKGFGKGNNWNMPGFNSGPNTPPPGYRGPNQNFNNFAQPNRPMPMQRPNMPPAPSMQQNRMPRMQQAPSARIQTPTMGTAPKAPTAAEMNRSIPKPSEVKGVILAPQNKPTQAPAKPGK